VTRSLDDKEKKGDKQRK